MRQSRLRLGRSFRGRAFGVFLLPSYPAFQRIRQRQSNHMRVGHTDLELCVMVAIRRYIAPTREGSSALENAHGNAGKRRTTISDLPAESRDTNVESGFSCAKLPNWSKTRAEIWRSELTLDLAVISQLSYLLAMIT
mgnify:CR=1 FL=1|jgi:hypothetical protein